MIPDWNTQLNKPAPIDTYGAIPGPNPFGIVYDTRVGPEELNQSNGVLTKRFWLVYAQGLNIYIAGANGTGGWENSFMFISVLKPISKLSLTFDQLGQPMLCILYTDNTAQLYWYDPVVSGYVFANIGNASDVITAIDHKDNTSDPDCEVVVFYVRSDEVFKRVQTDRFNSEQSIGVTGNNIRLKSCGVRIDNRYQLDIAADDIFTWPV